jgi:hypothetical protein
MHLSIRHNGVCMGGVKLLLENKEIVLSDYISICLYLS